MVLLKRHGKTGEQGTFLGLTSQKTCDIYRMTLTFLWIFYRAKEDWTFVLGLQHPWDAHAHHHDDDHHLDDDTPNEWVREKIGKAPVLGKKEDTH